MARPLTKKDVDILEERGYWKASSSLHKIIRRLIKRKAPLEIRFILAAHRIIFETAYQEGLAGKYRKDNPELKRIDGSILPISHWKNVPNDMAILDADLRETTKNLALPKTEKEHGYVISLAARFSHRLARIHPFENGNGRASRLLLSAVLLRVGLPDIAIRNPKQKYLRAMRQADNGDFAFLEEIIADALIKTREREHRILLRKRGELAKQKRRKTKKSIK